MQHNQVLTLIYSAILNLQIMTNVTGKHLTSIIKVLLMYKSTSHSSGYV